MKYKGFTLIELMITLAIIGILATMAIPAYQNYVIRARVTEGLSLASSAQTIIAENAVTGANDLSLGWTQPPSTTNVRSIVVAPTTGVITVSYTTLVNNIVLTLTPQSNGAAVASGTPPTGPMMWICAVTQANNDEYVPAQCRI